MNDEPRSPPSLSLSGLRNRFRLPLRSLAIVLGVSLGGGLVSAGEASGSSAVSVTARVVASARLRQVVQPTTVTLDATHVAAGQLVVAAPVSLTAVTNAAAGYVLEVSLGDGPFWLAEVSEGAEATLVDRGGAELLRNVAGPIVETRELRFTLYLEAGTEPGSYPWPVGLAVRPR